MTGKKRNLKVIALPPRSDIGVVRRTKHSSVVRWGAAVILACVAAAFLAYGSFRLRVMSDDIAYAKRAENQILAEKRQQQRLNEQRARLEQLAKARAMADAVALVGGKPITMTEIQEMVSDIPQLAELPFEKVYPNLLEMLVNNRVIMERAIETGVEDRPDIQKKLRLAREQIVGQTYLDEQLANRVTEEELRQVYEREVKEFRREEEIHARHILVKTKKEAEDLLIQLKAGADFAELADKKSLDENTQGGDLGYFTKGMMIPEFGDVVFDMKKGQLSDPIKTPFGWHVVRVEDKRLANPPAYDDVKEDIFRAVMETKLKDVLADERAQMQVEILRPTVE